MIDLLPLLQTHGYWLLFLFIIFEGGLIKFVGAFAASLGIFNVYIVFLLGVFGNLLVDTILFGIGRFGKKPLIDNILKHFKFGKEIVHGLRKAIKDHFWKAMFIIKLVPPFPVPGLMLTGASDISFKKFLVYSLSVTLLQSVVFTVLGFYSGLTVSTFLKYIKYGEWIAAVFVLIVVIIWLISKRFIRRIAPKVEKKIEK